MTARFQKTIQLAAEAFQHCLDLPFAVYLISEDGIFLQYNAEARSLFTLPPEPTFQDNITPFYLHPNDRVENLRQLQRTPRGQWLRNTTLDLKMGPVVKHVRDHSKAIWDEENNRIVGLLCLTVQMTKTDRYHRLFSDLPVGVFSFRIGVGLVHANPRFYEMHGYDSLDEIRYKQPADFMKNASNLKELTRKLSNEGKITDTYLENIRKDGTFFTASVSAKAMHDNDGSLIGFEGIVEDVSIADIYFKLVNEVPIGLFKVRFNDQGAHILIHCNQHFAQNRGAEQAEALIGMDLRDFHKSEADFHRFFTELIRKDEKGEFLTDYILEAFNGQGELRKYELYARLLKDAGGKASGLVGAERDVTDFWETKQQLEELTTDIGKVLHSYSSTLINSKHTMGAVVRSLVLEDEKIQKEAKLDYPGIMQKIASQISALERSITSVLEKNKTVAFFDAKIEEQLVYLMNLLKNSEERKVDTQKIALIRDGSIRIKELTREMGLGNFPRELTKKTGRQLNEILRLCSLVTLTHGVEAVLEMETGVNNLRSYILTRVKKREQLKKLDIYDLLLGVAKNMGEYAAQRNIELRMNIKEISNIYIQGYQEDLTRALLNIVHNAIKYSWSRKRPAKSFVKIEGRTDALWLYLDIENWGVAITPKELEDKLLFKVGYRGVNSQDRRRPGTGLGLYDAQKVIKKHRGKLSITSKPSLGNAEDDYSKPFKSNVIIQIPLIKQSL
ncbi:MAG: hypothetical protein DHS20C18_38060 [Saprospiraceae bacterium]|nr:MAG: hypothetical protein DHS20C18_38060 [Saprospiraceae bacterium]